MVVMPDGSFAANTRVEARNDETGRVWSTYSSGFGYYSLTLPAGTYSVSVPVKVPLRPENIMVVVTAGQEVLQDVPVQFHAQEDVHVKTEPEGFASFPRFAFDDGSLGASFSRAELDRMTLSHGPTLQSLQALVPGIVFTESVGTLAQFTSTGQRRFANRLTIDGVSADLAVDVRGQGIGEAGSGALPALASSGGTQTLVPLAAVEEVQIRTSNAAPEHARTPGAQTSIVTRSGGDRYTGALFTDWRPSPLAAQDWFSNAGEAPKRDLTLWNNGASNGGPLARQRVFYFAAWERQRISRPAKTTIEVPSESARAAASPEARAVLDAFPHPNGADLGTGWAEYTDTFAADSRLWDVSVRVDANLSLRHRAFVRLNRGTSSGDSLGKNTQLPFYSFAGLQQTSSTTATLGWTAILSSAAVNDLRANVTNYDGSELRGASDYGLAQLLPGWLGPAAGSLVEINLAQRSDASVYNGMTADTSQRQFQLVDTLTFVRGRHQWRVGFDYRRATVSATTPERGYIYMFRDVSDLVDADPRFVSLQFGGQARVRLETGALFAQDLFRVSPRVSMNLGVRYGIKPAPVDLTGTPPVLYEIDPLPTLKLREAHTPLWKTARANIGPQAGVAFELSQTPGREATIRAGWSLTYDEVTNPGASAFGRAFPYAATRTIRPNVFPVPESDLMAPRPSSFQSASIAEAYAFPRDMPSPWTSAWHVSAGRALGPTQRVSVSYVGSKSGNLPYWSGSYVGDPSHVINAISPDATSSYHGLLLDYVRRFSRGLQARAAYVRGQAVDTDSGESTTPNPPTYLVPVESNRGPSDFDRRHVLQLTTSYQSRAGWQIGLAGAFISGAPLTPVVSLPLDASGARYVLRPDAVPGEAIWIDDQKAPTGRRLNASAFQPAKGQGDVRRNTLRSSPLRQIDLMASRSLQLGTRAKMQVRLDVFNVFDIANFGPPRMITTNPASFGRAYQTYAQALGTGTLMFGGLTPVEQSGGPRAVQVSVRFALY